MYGKGEQKMWGGFKILWDEIFGVQVIKDPNELYSYVVFGLLVVLFFRNLSNAFFVWWIC